MSKEVKVFKIALVEGYAEDYAAYIERSDKTDDEVKSHGHKLPSALANHLKSELISMGGIDQRWSELHYRR